MRQQFALDFVELAIGEADRRVDGLAVDVTILSDHHVAIAQVLEVLGEGTQGTTDRVLVPFGFVFDALALNHALAQQVAEVDRELAVHDCHYLFQCNNPQSGIRANALHEHAVASSSRSSRLEATRLQRHRTGKLLRALGGTFSYPIQLDDSPAALTFDWLFSKYSEGRHICYIGSDTSNDIRGHKSTIDKCESLWVSAKRALD